MPLPRGTHMSAGRGDRRPTFWEPPMPTLTDGKASPSGNHCSYCAAGAPHCFVKINAKAHRTIAMAARTTAIVGFAIFFIFGVGCSWRGAVAGCGSWGGCVDNGSSCGVVLKLSNRFFGALAGARFFFGFRPRLLGIGKQ